jgi:HEAT repeat protein
LVHPETGRQKEGMMGIFGSPNIDKLKEMRNVSGLEEALSYKEGTIRLKAVLALGELGDSRAVESLINALNNEGNEVRITAASCLARADLRTPIEVQKLASNICALEDSSPAVRCKAARSLGELKDPRALQSLSVAIRNDTNRDVRLAVVTALGELAHLRAVDILMDAAFVSEDDPQFKERVFSSLDTLTTKMPDHPTLKTLHGAAVQFKQAAPTSQE